MENRKVLQVGIIGLGGVGGVVLEAFRVHPHINIAAVCDTSQSVVGKYQDLLDVNGYTNHLDLLDHEEIDLVYVAVPPKYHHRIVMDVLCKKKHILCEKPLANSLYEAREMLAAANEAGVVHAINFPTYYRQAFKKLETLVKDNYLGELRRIEVKAHFSQWPRPWQENSWISTREQGGFVREVLPHFIHLVYYLFGPVSHVRSQVEFPQDQNLCENGIIAAMELENGVSVLVDGVSGIAKAEEVLFTLYGTKGTLCLSNWNQLLGGGVLEPLAEIAVHNQSHLYDLVDNVVQSINGQPSEIVDFGVGVYVQNILEQLLGHNVG